MVAAMPHGVAKTTSKRNLTTNDLRSIAVGLATALAIVMLASAMSSDSGSATVLEESSEKRFAVPTISITTVAADGYISEDEADTNGFTVTGWATDADNDCDGGGACTVTVVMTDSAGTTHQETATVTASNTWSTSFAAGDIAALLDGTVTLTADVSNTDGAATTANAQAVLDTADPTISISSSH